MRRIGQPQSSERVGVYSRSSSCPDDFVGTMKVGQFDGVLPVNGTHKNFENPFEWLALFE